ncbi:MAG TPA: hypothetical protein VF511_06020 [Chthoniobacterales bacterium]
MPLVAGKSKEKKTDTIMGEATDRLLIATKKKYFVKKAGLIMTSSLAKVSVRR